MAPALFVTLAPSLSVRLIALDVPALIVPEFVIVKFAESIPWIVLATVADIVEPDSTITVPPVCLFIHEGLFCPSSVAPSITFKVAFEPVNCCNTLLSVFTVEVAFAPMSSA